MRKINSIIMALILIAVLVIPAFAYEQGTTYYIDSVLGSDANDGLSPETAYKTIEKAASNEYEPGDKILFHCGQTFEGSFNASGNGTKENPIIMSSYGDGSKPVFTSSNGLFLFILFGCDYWTIDNIEFTNEIGGSFLIEAYGSDTVGVTVSNCYFHDISLTSDNVFGAAIVVDNDRKEYKVRDLHIQNVEIKNTHWGIHINGNNCENENCEFVSPEESYNSNILIENVIIENAYDGGIVVGATRDSVVRNCRVTNSATAQDSAYAPLWIRHSDNVLVEYCEISGSTNKQDGMAVDFDGWTTNCTYDHIYSHDNTRFVKNCVFDAKTRNNGNKVTNCISVNDNRKINMSAIMLFSTSKPSFSYMSNFAFRNNTIVNGSPILWACTPFGKNENNTYIGSFINVFLHRIFNLLSVSKGNEYYTEIPSDLQSSIEEITSRIGFDK